MYNGAFECMRSILSRSPLAFGNLRVLGCPGPFTSAVSREIKARPPPFGSSRLGSVREKKGRSESSRMDRFKPREDRFAFIVALGRTFISFGKNVPRLHSRISTADNVERGSQQPFFSTAIARTMAEAAKVLRNEWRSL